MLWLITSPISHNVKTTDWWSEQHLHLFISGRFYSKQLTNDLMRVVYKRSLLLLAHPLANLVILTHLYSLIGPQLSKYPSRDPSMVLPFIPGNTFPSKRMEAMYHKNGSKHPYGIPCQSMGSTRIVPYETLFRVKIPQSGKFWYCTDQNRSTFWYSPLLRVRSTQCCAGILLVSGWE